MKVIIVIYQKRVQHGLHRRAATTTTTTPPYDVRIFSDQLITNSFLSVYSNESNFFQQVAPLGIER